MGDNCEKTIDKPNSRDGSKKDEPEEEEYVNLLIDDVQWEHTEGIMLLNCSRRTIFVERAFCNL